MKNIILGSLVTLSIFSCAKKENIETSSDNSAVNDSSQNMTNSVQVQVSGDVLVQNADCVSCHNKDEKMVGPSYKEIAAKYPQNDQNLDLLAEKIINGGAGNWGQVPMPPHAGLSKEDAKEMVKYILSQR